MKALHQRARHFHPSTQDEVDLTFVLEGLAKITRPALILLGIVVCLGTIALAIH